MSGEIRSERRQRRRHRGLRRGRRHARQRARAEGRQGGDPGGGPAHRIHRLRQRRVGELRPTRLEGHAHHLRRLAGSQGFPQPAGLDRQVGRRLDDALGRRLAALPGARVQDRDDLRPRSPAPICSTGRSRWRRWSPITRSAEDKMGVTRTNDIPGLPGNNNFKVMKAGADKLGYKECHTGRMAINSSRATTAIPASRPASASRAANGARNGRRSTPRFRRARRPAIWRCAPTAMSRRSSMTRPAR